VGKKYESEKKEVCLEADSESGYGFNPSSSKSLNAFTMV